MSVYQIIRSVYYLVNSRYYYIEEEVLMKFTEEQVKKFSRGSLIKKKLMRKSKNVVIETLDTNAIEQINSNVLKCYKRCTTKRP